MKRTEDMTKDMTHDIQATKPGGQLGEIILYQPDETVRLEVRLEDETVWLTQAQMAELFQKDQSVIARHIGNVFREGELEEKSNMQILHNTLSKYKPTKVYSLNVIISVGYRVKSKRGTQFRIWATSVLRDFLLRGYAINRQLTELERHVDARFDAHILTEEQRFRKIEQVLSDHQQKIDFFVRTSLPPVEGVFYDGQIFDAYKQIVSLIKQARRSIVLIDNYIDETTLTMLSKRDACVSATVYTRPLSQQQQLDLQRHNQQYSPITVNICQRNHDRFLIIDDTVYLFGASLKDAGKKFFAYIKMLETSAAELMNGIR